MTEILDENKLNDLPTKKFYDQLNNAENSCQGNELYISAKKILDYYNGLKNVSDKILKALCYVHGNNIQNETDDDICNFLYYWLGDILYDNLTHRIYLNSVISNIFFILKSFNGKNCTAPRYYDIFEEKYFKNIKLFFDYSKDYHIYEKQISNNNPTCNEKYYEYLQKYVETYKGFEVECQNRPYFTGYCNAFNKYFDKKYRTNLSKLTCKLQNKELEEEKAPGETENTKEQHLLVSGLGEKSVFLPEATDGRVEQVAEPPSSPVYTSSEGTSELSSDSGPVDDSPTPTITKSIVTAASAAGLLMPPFLIYNFTPVRSWINKLLGRNQIYRNPLTERELIENSYQPDNFDSERNRYNISYRPE